MPFQSFYEIYEQPRVNPSIYKNIVETSNVDLLRDTLKTLIDSDPRQVRNLVNTQNNIVFFRKFVMQPKATYLYRAPFNNDARRLTWPEERIMLCVDNYSKTKTDEHFYLRVFLNQKLLTEGKDFDVVSSLGSKRIFVKAALVRDFDVIFVVAHRKYRLTASSAHLIHTPTSKYAGDFTFDIESFNIGRTFGNADHLMVYHKPIDGSKFIYLKRGEEYFVNQIATEHFQITMNVDLARFDKVLIMNKLGYYSIEFDTTEHLLAQEYADANGKYLTIPLRVYNDYYREWLPFPILNVNEIDLYAAGYKLIPEQDYTIEVHENVNSVATIKFNRLLAKGARVRIENRCYDEVYNIVRIQANLDNAEGFIPLNDAKVPADPRYIEVFVGRKKVPESDIEVIADCILKINNQRTMDKLEVRSNLMVSEMFKFMDQTYQLNKSPMAEVVNYMGYPAFIAEYKSKNPVAANNINVDPPGDPFLGEGLLQSIEVVSDRDVYVQEIDIPTYSVVAHFANGSTHDITDKCVLEKPNYTDFFDEEYVDFARAEYTYMGQRFTAEKQVKFVEKTITNVLIEIDSYVFEINKSIDYRVFASFTDNSRREITNDPRLQMTIPPSSAIGTFPMKAKLVKNGVTYEDNMNITFVQFKEVDSIDIVPAKTFINPGETVDFDVIVRFTDFTTKNVKNEVAITGYIPGVAGPQHLQVTYDHGQVYVGEKDVNFVLKQTPLKAVVTESEGTCRIAFEGNVPSEYAYYRVFRPNFDKSGMMLCTVGYIPIFEKDILFTDIVTPRGVDYSELVVEVYDSEFLKVDTFKGVETTINPYPLSTAGLTHDMALDGADLVVTFSASVQNAIISLNRMFFPYIHTAPNTVKFLATEAVFDSTTLANNRVTATGWQNISKHATFRSVSKDGEVFTLAQPADANTVLSAAGVAYRFNINPADPTKVTLIGAAEGVVDSLPADSLFVSKFRHSDGTTPILKSAMIGRKNGTLNECVMNVDVSQALITVDGVHYSYTLGDNSQVHNNVVSYDVPGELPVFDGNSEVLALTFNPVSSAYPIYRDEGIYPR